MTLLLLGINAELLIGFEFKAADISNPLNVFENISCDFDSGITITFVRSVSISCPHCFWELLNALFEIIDELELEADEAHDWKALWNGVFTIVAELP